MKKRILSVLLAVCMAVCLVPTTAFAGMFDDVKPIDPITGDVTIFNYDISVGGVKVTNKNQSDVLGDGKVSFRYDVVNSKGVLTLNGAHISSGDKCVIQAPDMQNLEIVIKGENELTSDENCIMANNLTFDGDGSLKISNGFFYAVDCTGSVTVNGGNIKVNSVDTALCLDGALTVNGGTLELIASDDYGYAIDFGWSDLNVVLGDDRIMITGTNPDGSNASVTAASEEDTIKDARYIKIFNKYTPITYSPGRYGTGTAVTENKTYGEPYTIARNSFTRVGYIDTGWRTADGSGSVTDGECEYYAGNSTYTVDEPLTLYPRWIVDTYSIKYDLDGGTDENNRFSYTIETDSFTLNNPVKDGGYEFAGWSGTGLDGNDNMTVTISKGSVGNRSYKAHWRDIQTPIVNGIEDGKTYCSAVEFTASDNDGEPTVTVNGTPLNSQNGKYILAPADGEQLVVVSDNDNRLEFTVRVNDGHTGGTAICIEKAVCEVCGESYGELDPDNHSDLQHFAAKPATETEEGNIEYWYCSGCGKYFFDSSCEKEISKADTVTAKLEKKNTDNTAKTTKTDNSTKSPKTGADYTSALCIAALLSGGAITVLFSKKKKRA